MKKEIKMKTVTLTNSFHGTSVSVGVPEYAAGSQEDAWAYIQEKAYPVSTKPDRKQYNRVRRALCGISDCQCGIVR